MNNTKIVATIGPSSYDKAILKEMFAAGLNVVRINFSHSNHEQAIQIFNWVQELNTEEDRNVAVLGDLQGPKLRLGDVKPDQILKRGKEVIITTDECIGDVSKIYITYPDFPKDVKVGDRIMLDDGKLILKAEATNGENEVRAKVVQGGPLKSKKGVNLPNTKISLPCLTPKDLADLECALEIGIEWIGLSFVRNVQDVKLLQKIIKERKSPARVIAKIEKPEAIRQIDAIIKQSGAVMVARGDLGVEVPMERVPNLQKMITRKCIKYSTPVIIATQMMESMMDSLSPSRSDVNDVANAVHDRVDGVMLSGETSVGKYPIRVIKAMSKVVKNVENYADLEMEEFMPIDKNDGRFLSDTICYNACKIAEQVGAKAVMTMTHSGYNAFKIASFRPPSKICIFTNNRKIMNTLSLLWGVRGYYYDSFASTDDTMSEIKNIIKAKGIIQKDDLVVNIASMPITEKGMTNMLKLSSVD
ncbi:MAG: pyruvate kinase [Flavobacteriales bacterium]|jgi:pyruvate kinase|tara:strand:- start:24268 stop:25686 length:1419 start_codon:yes stop_codon:yes gene_type:complete